MNILFRKIGLKDAGTSHLQSNVEQAFQIIASLPFVSGEIYEVEATGEFNILTGLGKSPQGWLLVDADTASTFYRTKGPLDDLGTLTLTPSASGTYKFWVF